MSNRRKKRLAILWCAAACAVVLGGGFVLAWPVLFPLVPAGAGPPASNTGIQLISQPYANPLADAKDLIDDINLTAGAPVVLNVGRYLTSIDTFAAYTGSAGVAFPLVPSEGYLVQVTAAVPYMIGVGGGILPGFAIGLAGPGPGSRSGTHLLSIPDVDIPAPLADAEDLLVLMGATATQVCRHIRTNDLFACYTGSTGLPFPLNPGEAYLVQVSAFTGFAMP
jgi:hypothetical protein